MSRKFTIFNTDCHLIERPRTLFAREREIRLNSSRYSPGTPERLSLCRASFSRKITASTKERKRERESRANALAIREIAYSVHDMSSLCQPPLSFSSRKKTRFGRARELARAEYRSSIHRISYRFRYIIRALEQQCGIPDSQRLSYQNYESIRIIGYYVKWRITGLANQPPPPRID